MMLQRRAVRLQSRLPIPVLGRHLQHDTLACRQNSVVPWLPFHLVRQQIRPYLFIPVSWAEARERFERWLERSESRIVKVTLLKRRRQMVTPQASKSQLQRRKPRNAFKKRSWSQSELNKFKYKMRKGLLQPKNYLRTLPSLHLPTTGSTLSSLKVVKIKKAYQGWKILRKNQYIMWKDRRKEQYQGWKSRRQIQYQGWKLRREAQYQRWKIERSHKSMKRRTVLLKEYSRSEWFDGFGRPLTARDSTGRFVNPWQSQTTNGVHSLDIIVRWKWQRFVRENISAFSELISPPKQSDETSSSATSSPLLTQLIPPLPVPKESNLHLTWIGHSTCFLQVKKRFTILSDPIFSSRASPFKNFIGVARDVPPACSIQELIQHQRTYNLMDDRDRDIREQNFDHEALDLCCITHDHYDHMDKQSVQDLNHHVQLWIVPLGIGDWLVESCSIDREKIVEMQWWQQLRVIKIEGRVVVLENHIDEDMLSDENEHKDDEVLTITCCPSSHWSGRTMFDRNMRLWCSFAFSVTSFKIFLCGDSGYPKFPLFRQIGDALGPFDLSCIPIGAYEPKEMNKDSHCNPQEAVEIHKDLHSKHSVAVHWGSFQLTEEAMDAPPRELKDAIRSEHQYEGTWRKKDTSDPYSDGSIYPPIKFSILGHGETLVLKDQKSDSGTITSISE